jgi:Ca2+-binding RTX toxin-like protein
MGNLSNSVHNFIATASDSLGHAGSTQFVFGTTGNDTITSSAANEVLFGNGGHDTFAISGNVGRGTIADFQASNDMVQLSHNVFSNFADVLAHAAQVGSDVTISIDPSNSVTLHNTMLTQLTTNNFHLV